MNVELCYLFEEVILAGETSIVSGKGIELDNFVSWKKYKMLTGYHQLHLFSNHYNSTVLIGKLTQPGMAFHAYELTKGWRNFSS